MATSREHFALDWIKAELLETLNGARAGLEGYAEAFEERPADGSPEVNELLRRCVIALHQVHGTLVMLELKGVTMLADHLERVAGHLMNGQVENVPAACQSLMQGVLELPGYLDELQAGLPDSAVPVLPLINELRSHLGEAPLDEAEGVRLYGVADEAALARFEAIDGIAKARRIRAVYQQVLLKVLKGGEMAQAVGTLRKVAHGMSRVCDGTPFAAQWQAFGEFVESLPLGSDGGAMDGAAVKLLRRVDSEIREIAQFGRPALERPVSIALVRQLLDAAASRGRQSKLLDGLMGAAARGEQPDSLSLSGRQALISAAQALREELGTIKDRLDLFARGGGSRTTLLGELLAPLKQIASTLSLLGFESSQSIISDQVAALSALVSAGEADESAILNVAGALVQVDENLASHTHSGRGEMEKITDEAERAVAQQTREGLDRVKQAIVDYISSQWDVRHLEHCAAELEAIAGALSMIPLPEAAEATARCRSYLLLELMAGHVPTWNELDGLADALSGIDYYLERLASDNPGGAEKVLDVVRRSLDGLGASASAAPRGGETGTSAAASAEASEPIPAEDMAAVQERVAEAPAPQAPAARDQAVAADFAPEEALFGAARDVDVAAIGETGEDSEPELILEAEEDFDLGSELFDDISEEPPASAEIRARGAEVEGDDAPPADEEWQLELEDEAAVEEEGDELGSRQAAAGGGREGANPGVAPPETLVDSFEAEADIVEIFVEEVDEVLAAVDEHLPSWAAALGDETHLGELRRAFHTLKGSGRMVGANVLGEMAWSVENMLNRLLDATVPATPEFPVVVRRARDLVLKLKGAFQSKAIPPMADVAGIMEEADVLASGGTLAETDAAAADDAADDDALFLAEAGGHVQALLAGCRGHDFLLDDDVMRALHTLSGSAAMAGLVSVGELAGPAYSLARALRGSGAGTMLDGERAEFFRDVTATMAGMIEDLEAGRVPAEHFQLIADADRLLGCAEERSASSALTTLPAAATLAQASELLECWYTGIEDVTLAGEVRRALAELSRAAAAKRRNEVAVLARALLGAHERFTAGIPHPAAREIFHRGHEALLVQLDALAADQTPADEAALVAALDLLAPEALDAEPALPPAAEPVIAVADEPVAGEEPAPVPEDVDADIIAVFFEEADEILEALDQGINAWSSEPANRLHLENLLRGLHTLKGGARLSGLLRLGDRTHDLESFLIAFQERTRPAEPELFEELHGRYDEIASFIAAAKAGLAGDAVEGARRAPQAPMEPAAPAWVSCDEPQTAPMEDDRPPLESPASEGAREEPPARRSTDTHAPGVARPANVAPLRRRERKEVAEQAADAVQSRAAQEMVRVGAGLLENLVNLAGESSIIRARVEQGMSDFTSALDEMETTIDRLREQLRRLEIETEAQILFRHDRLDGPAYEDFDPLEMDRYSQLQQLSRSLGESASDMLDLKETLLFKAREAETLLLQQARVNTELQEGLMRSRMVPFSRLLPRLKRTVRQVAKELDKDVELHAFNVEGELDRTLLERMVPPLEHMLRNAVDHGIEKPGERRARGKAEAGRIDLRLSREGGDVVIEISDDGAGIDVERVRAKALERGLMAPDATLKDDEISQFVLAPGFSTATSVTQISGRGVGMDVVASEVKQLGGSIDIFSQPGKGTRFVLRVPFTVSVNRALMVSVADDLYAIPLNTIEGIVLLSPEEIERVYAPDGHTFEYAGVPYRVQYLGNFLGRAYQPQGLQGSVPVVLVRSGEQAVAVHVDGVQGSREIVVKSLGPQFAGVGGISGATILGDGSVVVILDLLALIRSQRAGDRSSRKRVLKGAPRTRCVMVVDDSVTVRKVTSRLLERQSMDVVVAKDGVEAVALLQERRPDVMLLDIEMPRMDGFEVLRQVRHDERLRDLPIVMISSRTGSKHQDRAAELGVSRFLGKPFQESELLATIEELVSRHG